MASGKTRRSDLLSGITLAALLGFGGIAYRIIFDIRKDIVGRITDVRTEHHDELREHRRAGTHAAGGQRIAKLEALVKACGCWRSQR